MSPFTVVPTKASLDVFTLAMWNASIRDNLNKGVIRPVAEATLGADAASIDFTSIAADWSHLLISAYARASVASVSTELIVRFNGDAGANYDRQTCFGIQSSASASESLAQSSASVALIPGASAGANLFGGGVAAIPHYEGSVNHKFLVALNARKYGTATGELAAAIRANFWRSAAAINQLTFSALSGNLITGTRISVYGMGGI